MTTPDRYIAWLVASSGFSAEERSRRESELNKHTTGAIQIRLLTPTDSPSFLSQPDDFDPAISSMAAFAATLDPAVYPVAVLAGAIDPGISKIREQSAVPVVAAFEATIRLAATMSRRVAVLTSDPVIAGATEQKLADDFPDADVVTIRNIGVSVETIAGMMHDADAIEQVRAKIIDAARAARDEDGADAFQFGCMTFATLDVKDRLLAEFGLPVLDPARISIRTAEIIASLQPSQLPEAA